MDYAYSLLKIKPEIIWKSKTPLHIHPILPSSKWIHEKKTYLHKKYSAFLKRFQSIPNLEPLTLCYDHIGAFSNVSLSVHPSIKQRWKRDYGLSHELFGAFYNTDPEMTYCSIFPELEAPRGGCNAYTFRPKKGDTYLANPPYTTSHIRWMIRSILDKWRTSNWIIILPVWDAPTRKRLGLSNQPLFPEIDELLAATPHHHRTYKQFLFYNGFTGKDVLLKDPVHVIYCWATH
jgi:hypothetical protein